MKYSKNIIFQVFIFAFILQCVVYFGFESAYFNYKNLEQLPSFYSENIYRYRFLAIDLFVEFAHWFEPLFERLKDSETISKNAKTLGSNFYLCFFIFNTFFFLALVFLLFKTFSLFNYKNTNALQFILIAIILVAFSEYVITPYDMLAYCLNVIGIYFTLQFFNTRKIIFFSLFCISIIISTLVRETSAINLAFFMVVFIKKNRFDFREIKSKIWLILVPTFLFVLTYIGLRFYFGSPEVIQGNYWVQNLLKPKNILGIAFFIVVSRYLIYLSQKKNLLRLFIFFCAPYLVTIFFGGILWEIRLFTPLFLSMIFLCNYKNIELNA